MRPEHDCAQVERDNLDLHKALAEAIRRLGLARRQLAGVLFDPFGYPELSTSDLLEVLDRTSRPTRAPGRPGQEFAL